MRFAKLHTDKQATEEGLPAKANCALQTAAYRTANAKVCTLMSCGRLMLWQTNGQPPMGLY